nr:hypothetical protein [uncultured Bacillus sp.]
MTAGRSIVFSAEFAELSGLKEIAWKDEYCTQFQPQIPFLYETADVYCLNVWKPWDHPDESVPLIIEQWEVLREELQVKFTNRNQQGVLGLMRKGIAFFYEMLFWCNQSPVVLHPKRISSLSLKPINMEERLVFVRLRPSNYHSYIQLTELFTELHKLFSKEQARRKGATL